MKIDKLTSGSKGTHLDRGELKETNNSDNMLFHLYGNALAILDGSQNVVACGRVNQASEEEYKNFAHGLKNFVDSYSGGNMVGMVGHHEEIDLDI